MPLQWEKIDIPLIGGLDTKSDPKALAPGKAVQADNLVFDETGNVGKRGGFGLMGLGTTAGGTIEAARLRALGVLGDQLVLFAAGRVYVWIEKEAKWADRGRHEAPLVDQRTYIFERTEQKDSDSAELGNVIVVCWTDTKAGGIRYAAIDKATGAIMDSSSTPFVSGGSHARVRKVNDRLQVIYREGTALKVDVIDPDDVYGTMGAAPITIVTEATALGVYDAEPMGANLLLAWTYSNAGTLEYKLRIINSAGSQVVATTAKARSADTAKAIAVSYHATPNRICVARVAITDDDVYLDYIKADLTDETFVDLKIADSVESVRGVTCVMRSDGTAYVWWDDGVTGGGVPAILVKRGAQPFSASAATVKAFVRHSHVGSRAVRWTDGTVERYLIHVLYAGQAFEADGTTPSTDTVQACYVLLDGDFVIGAPEGSTPGTGEEVGLIARLLPGVGGGRSGISTGYLPQIQDLGSSQFAAALSFRLRYRPGFSERGFRNFTYTFNDSRAYVGHEEGGALILPGGYVSEFDGQRMRESGIFLAPEEVQIVETTTGGGLQDSTTYRYKLYLEDRNAAGEVVWSTFVGVYAKATTASGGNDNQFTFTIRTQPYTNRPHVTLGVYRESRHTAGVYHRISSRDPATWTENEINQNTITFTDTGMNAQSDELVDEGDQEADPFPAPGLDPVPCPPTHVIAVGQTRAFAVDPENRSKIYIARQRPEGDAVMFTDGDSLQVPQFGGPVENMNVGDNTLFALKQDAVYITAGQGPDNSGNGPYPPFQKIAEVGCVESRSVVRCPIGLLFRSRKGFYVLSPQNEARFIGGPIEDYLTSDVTVNSAVHLPDRHQVRFTTTSSTAPILVFDYLVGEWSRWTVGGGGTPLHSVIWQNQHVILRTDGVLEPSATFADGDLAGAPTMYVAKWVSGWITLSGLAGYVRLKWIQLLGEFRATHNLLVTVAYDFDGAKTDPQKTWIPVDASGAALTAGKPMRLRVFPQLYPKCTAFRVTIEDINQGATPLRDSFKLTGMSIMYGREQSAMPPLSAAQTK